MKKHLDNFLLLAAFVYLIVNSCFGFLNIAWGTGNWRGEFSLKWGAAFFLYIVGILFIYFCSYFYLI